MNRMRKGKFIVLFAILIGVTACGTKDTSQESEPVISEEVTASVEEENVNKITEESYPVITITGIQESYPTKDGKRDLCTSYIEKVALDNNAYPELEKSFADWSEKDFQKKQNEAEGYGNEDEDERAEWCQHEDFTFQVYYTASQKRADSQVLSLITEGCLQTGGAHPNNSVDGVSFDAETGKILEVTDVITDWDAFEKIAFPYAVDYLNKRAEAEEGYYEDVLKQDIQEWKWVLDDHGFVLLLDDSDWCHALGLAEIVIPYYLLKDCMHPAYIPDEDEVCMYILDADLENKEYLDGELCALDVVEDENAIQYFIRNVHGKCFFMKEVVGPYETNELIVYREEKRGVFTESDRVDACVNYSLMHGSGFETYQREEKFRVYSGVVRYEISDEGKFVEVSE